MELNELSLEHLFLEINAIAHAPEKGHVKIQALCNFAESLKLTAAQAELIAAYLNIFIQESINTIRITTEHNTNYVHGAHTRAKDILQKQKEGIARAIDFLSTLKMHKG